MSIKIQVAVCTHCKGYFSAAPFEQKNANHPDIIDHFFYHGEPWFTLDCKTFEKSKNLENTRIVITDLEEHVKDDHRYCHCKKKEIPVRSPYSYESSQAEKYTPYLEKNELETEIYFKDLYYTYNNFHSIAASGHHRNSANKF
ncbi:hypothetical protein [Chryseobacterium sp. sg2396]|uniref:hypothetical protein n=1 Tax=Chryseobacterium sp. sg2396 TaxID=3276280 RepID=UPI0025DE6D1F|nr:hypothetical protein [uncultured Chryseobacterium sp.]